MPGGKGYQKVHKQDPTPSGLAIGLMHFVFFEGCLFAELCETGQARLRRNFFGPSSQNGLSHTT
jgi:hypothetical protein